MIKKLRHRPLLVAISLLALLVLVLGASGSGAVQAGSRHSAADPRPSFELFVTITGAKQGQFKGESSQKGFETTIPAFNFTFALTTSTLTTGTGISLPGRLKAAPITITKNVGVASPQILQAIVTNELLTTVLFQFDVLDPAGRLLLHHTVKLTQAHFTSFKQYLPQQDGPELEDITFSYRHLEYTQDGSTITINT